MTSRVGNWLAIVAFRWRCWMYQAGSRTCRESAVDLPADSACQAESAGRTVVECGHRLCRSCRQLLPPDLVIRAVSRWKTRSRVCGHFQNYMDGIAAARLIRGSFRRGSERWQTDPRRLQCAWIGFRRK